MASPLHPGTHATALTHASPLVSGPAGNHRAGIGVIIDRPGVTNDNGDVNVVMGGD